MKRTPLGWRAVVLLALSVLIGIVVAAPPVGAHVGGTVQHLWRDHIRPKADARYLNDSITSAAVGPLPGVELLGDADGNDDGTCEANETCQLAVTCPAGDLVLNGGFRLVDQGSVVLESYAGLGNEWDVSVSNDATIDSFVVNAHCINR